MRVDTVSIANPASTGNQALVVHMADVCPALVTGTQTHVIQKRVSAGADTTLLVSIAMSVQLATTVMPRQEAPMPAPLVPVLWWVADQALATQRQEGQRARPQSAQNVLKVDWELVVSYVVRAPGVIPQQILPDPANHVNAVETPISPDQAVVIAVLGSA